MNTCIVESLRTNLSKPCPYSKLSCNNRKCQQVSTTGNRRVYHFADRRNSLYIEDGLAKNRSENMEKSVRAKNPLFARFVSETSIRKITRTSAFLKRNVGPTKMRRFDATFKKMNAIK